MLKFVLAAAILLVTLQAAMTEGKPEADAPEPGFEELTHPTLDLEAVHTLPRGAVVCQEAELPDTRTYIQRRCEHLERPLKIKLGVIYHGISEPQYFFHALSGRPVKGWTTRSFIK